MPSGENGLNEKRIQQVLDIEKQAQEAYEAAVAEAKQIPAQAEQEAQEWVDKARADAEAEAQQMLRKAQSEDEGNQLLSQTQEKLQRTEVLAQGNLKRAVVDVLCRVAGKE